MSYTSLPMSILSKGATYSRREEQKYNRCKLSDPALTVMTDLKSTTVYVIGAHEPIVTANQKMINLKVHMFFVVNVNDELLGLITASDILGEKPMKYIQKYGGVRDDIQVQDIMTHYDKLEVLSIQQISNAKVGDILETLKHVNRHHALVADNQGPDNQQTIRGILSLTQIARQTGVELTSSGAFEGVQEIFKKAK